VAARYALIALCGLFIAIMSVLFLRRPTARQEDEADPAALVRSLAIVPSGPDSASHAAAGVVAERVGRALRSAGLRVLTTDAPTAIPRSRLRQLLNVGATLYVAAAADGSPRLDAVLRDADDSTLLARSYGVTADASQAEDAIATDVAAAMSRVAMLRMPSRIHVADVASVQPHLARADALWRARDAQAAEAAFHEAIRIDPQDATVRHRYAQMLAEIGRTGESLREARRAHELDPLSVELHLAYARLLERAGRAVEAAHELAEQRRIATIMHPNPAEHVQALSRRRARTAQRQRR